MSEQNKIEVERNMRNEISHAYINICTREFCISAKTRTKMKYQWSEVEKTDLMANFTCGVSFLVAPALNTCSMSILHMKSESINTISLNMDTENNNICFII